MLGLRATLFYTGMVLFTLMEVALLPITMLLPYRLRYRVIVQWARATLWWLELTCGLGFRVEGREHIPEGTAIVFAKHQSAWETIAMQMIFPVQTWVLKRELLFIPLFGWGLALTRPVAIDRKAGKKALKQVIEQGTRRLSEGLWLIIFPEGTRVAPGERGKYAVGGALLAEKSGYPVVPVAHNAGEFWPKQGFIKRPGVITLAIGPIIETRGRKASVIMQEAEAWIEGKMAEITTSDLPPAALEKTD